jgi:hypothetical protein
MAKLTGYRTTFKYKAEQYMYWYNKSAVNVLSILSKVFKTYIYFTNHLDIADIKQILLARFEEFYPIDASNYITLTGCVNCLKRGVKSLGYSTVGFEHYVFTFCGVERNYLLSCVFAAYMK